MEIPPLPQSVASGSTTPPTPSLPRKPFLGWWAIIPILAYLCVQGFYGMNEARFRATGKQYVTSYFMGGLLAAPFYSLVISWIFYRLFKRSRKVAGIMFAIVMIAFINYAFVSGRRWQRMTAASTTPHEFLLSGFKACAPPGWEEVKADKTVIVRWIDRSAGLWKANGAILVGLGDPTSGDAHYYATQLAQKLGGRIKGQATLDGEPAWVVAVDSPISPTDPIEMLVCFHNGKMYTIQVEAISGSAYGGAAEAIVSSWQWMAAPAGVARAQVGTKQMSICGGKLTITVPTYTKTFEVSDSDPTQAAGLRLFNQSRNHDDFRVVINAGDIPFGSTNDGGNPEVFTGNALQQMFQLPEAFVWHSVKPSPRSTVTQAVPGPKADGINWMMLGYVELNEKQIALFNISIYATDPNERAAYVKLGEQMVESATGNSLPRK